MNARVWAQTQMHAALGYLFTVWFVSDQIHLPIAPLPHNSHE